MSKRLLAAATLAALAAGAGAPLHAAAADEDSAELNVYSARGAATDEDLYNSFMASTGLRVQRFENDDATTLQMLADEQGADAKADVVLLNGLAHLHTAAQDGLLQPLASETLTQAVPQALRGTAVQDRGALWYGLSRHARVIVYSADQLDAQDLRSYADLADARHKGKLCLTSLDSAANQSLLAAMIAHDGRDSAEQWLRGVTDNLARPPAGTDAEQIAAVAAGQCQITLADHNTVARLRHADNEEERDIGQSVAVVFPNQQSWDTHMDVAGAGLAKNAPHPQAAVQFLEYLAGDQGQNLFANSNDEWPVDPELQFDNDALAALTEDQPDFKADETPLADLAQHLDTARELAAAFSSAHDRESGTH